MRVTLGKVVPTATRMLERASPVGPSRDTRVQWHHDLCPEVEDAYAAVRGETWLPLELLGRVFATPGPHEKRIVVTYRNELPRAVVPMRLTGRYWEPLCQGVIPELPLFPCVADAGGVLAAIGVNFGCWSSIDQPLHWTNVRWSEEIPCYELDLAADPDTYWRESGVWKTLNRVKRQTADLELVVDDADGARWTIENWRDRHHTGDPRQVTAKWRDRMTVAEWGLGRGLMHCWNLRDGGAWVSGLTGFVRDGRMSSGSIFRDPRYDRQGVGNRLWYDLFMWSYQNELRTVSMGAQFDYKSYWAPPAGRLWNFVVAPLPVHLINAAADRADRLARAVGWA